MMRLPIADPASTSCVTAHASCSGATGHGSHGMDGGTVDWSKASADGASLPSGRFQIVELIGEGASARVYKAIERSTQSTVAIKVLAPHLQTDDISIERFRREIRMTRMLNHPQIVAIYDLVREGSLTYLVMEYLPGHDLKHFLHLHAPVGIDTVIAILTQVLRVLGVCHAKNVIHRDLKPQNIIIDAETTVKLADFGIAKMIGASDLTQTGAAIGSPEYMAPELFASNLYDPRTDIYALGVIAFELITGELPFRGDSLAVLYNQHVNTPVPGLKNFRADAPEWLQHVVERMLAKQAYARYQSSDEVLADITRRRVLTREIPALRRTECARCGGLSAAELPVCVLCGQHAADTLRPGDYDVICSQDEDDAKLQQYVHAVFGVQETIRRKRRTLLITGLDAFPADIIRKSAQAHGLFLTVEPHSGCPELRKAVALALASFFCGDLCYIVSRQLDFYGQYYLAQLEALQSLQLGLLLAIAAVSLRRFLQIEVRPLWPLRRARGATVTGAYAWVARLVPFFGPERTDAAKAFVAELIESYLKLRKFGRDIDPAVNETLQHVIGSAAQLAAVASEIQVGLQAPAWVQRIQRYAALARSNSLCEAEEEADSAALRVEVCAYYALEEKHATIANKLIYLRALFNNLVGRVLVLRSAIDDENRADLDGWIRTLADDLMLSRQVQQELERLA
jgi:tRNA A-37 threonylcarbamoyl transferase component Bud32